MKKTIFNIGICMSILFISFFSLSKANPSAEAEPIVTVREEIEANKAKEVSVYVLQERMSIAAYDERHKVTPVYSEEVVINDDLSKIDAREKKDVLATEADIEYSHPSAYIPQATINVFSHSDGTVEKTTSFSNGQTFDYDIDEYIDNTEDIDLLYKLVHSESGTESSLGRRLVADCVLNAAKSRGITIRQAIMTPGQFEVVAKGSIFKTVPDEMTVDCVNTELVSQIDYSVMYFRTNHYHNFGVPYEHVGNHYFSKPAADDVTQWQ